MNKIKIIRGQSDYIFFFCIRVPGIRIASFTSTSLNLNNWIVKWTVWMIDLNR